MTLTHKQRLFLEAYVSNGGNGAQAALAAGYSPRCAYVQASENLRKPYLAEAIERRMPGLIGQAQRAAREQPPCLVYVIAAPLVSRYKIGITTQRPMRRLEALQTGSPVPLELVITFPGGAETEAALHRRFTARRAHGEWFDLTPSDLDWLTRYGHEQTESVRAPASIC